MNTFRHTGSHRCRTGSRAHRADRKRRRCATPSAARAVSSVPQGQITLVQFDRSAGLVHMVPNIRHRRGRRCARIGGADTGPPLPRSGRRADSGTMRSRFTGRSRARRTVVAAERTMTGSRAPVSTEYSGGDVTVHGTGNVVGAFEADDQSPPTPWMISAAWLTDRGFAFTTADEAAFEPLVADGWFFTAMTLAPGTTLPPSGWNRSVDPVRFSYEADAFVAPRQVLIAAGSIGSFFVIDDHRMAMTWLRHRVRQSHQLARCWRRSARHSPRFAEYVREGGFVTASRSRRSVPRRLTRDPTRPATGQRPRGGSDRVVGGRVPGADRGTRRVGPPIPASAASPRFTGPVAKSPRVDPLVPNHPNSSTADYRLGRIS